MLQRTLMMFSAGRLLKHQCRSGGFQSHFQNDVRQFVQPLATITSSELRGGGSERDMLATALLECPLHYECPICCDGRKWGPSEMMRHMNYHHHHGEVALQSTFTRYNSDVMSQIEQSAKETDATIVIDLANNELGIDWSDVEQLLQARDLHNFFLNYSLTLVVTHETFISHEAKLPQLFHILMHRNACSRRFTLYATDRLDSGDLLSATVVNRLLSHHELEAPVVLVSGDFGQTLSLTSLYDNSRLQVVRFPHSPLYWASMLRAAIS